MRSAVIAMLFAGGIVRGAQSPSEAAVEWLRHVADGEAETDLADETAISPDASEEDLKSIRKRIDHLRKDLRAGDLKAVADKQDGDLAAVLVSQITNYDANSVQVHAVGLVKSEDRWLPAPLPSSFNNTGLSLRPGFLQRVQKLEDWMLRTRSAQLVRLKDDAFSLLFDEMKKAKIPHGLLESSPGKIAADFLTALQSKDLPSALAMSGGLETPRPTDFDEVFQVLSRVLRQKKITHPGWRLLAAPEAVRAVVRAEQGASDGLVSIVGLDPAGNFQARPQARAVHLPFVRSKAGTWRIHLPRELLSPPLHEKVPGREADDAAIDADLVASFPAKAAASLASGDAPTARVAAESIVAALRAPSFASVCARMDLSGEPDVVLAGVGRAAHLWQRIHHPSESSAPILLDVKEAGDGACALVQMFSNREPRNPAIETICLRRKQGGGWLAHPAFSGSDALPGFEDGGELEGLVAAALAAREKDWSAGVLVRIGGIAADSAPSEEEARKAAEGWRSAIVAGDGAGMLSLSACFDDEAGSTRLLKNTGYELASRQKGEILGIHRAGRWAALSLRVPPAAGDDSAASYPLVVVVATPAGPRVLPELDLFDPLTRSREFLNRSVWERVSARLPEGARGELESIYEKHRTLSAADRARRPKSTE